MLKVDSLPDLIQKRNKNLSENCFMWWLVGAKHLPTTTYPLDIRIGAKINPGLMFSDRGRQTLSIMAKFLTNIRRRRANG